MSSGGSGQICTGEVVHRRLHPTIHKLKYRVFSLLLDVDKLDQVQNKTRLFSLNKLNIFSLHERQHGYRDHRSVSQFAWDQIRKLGLEATVSRIDMLFYPRLFGFAFNPLTVYFCRGSGDAIVAMIYEVRNTFGGNLTYVMRAGEAKNGTYEHGTAKRFYVSPFNKVDGDYLFHVRKNSDELTVGVALLKNGKPILRTHFRGELQELTDMALIRAFFSYPLMTLKVVAGIHWEAAKLWRKGLKIQDGPTQPDQTTVIGN